MSTFEQLDTVQQNTVLTYINTYHLSESHLDTPVVKWLKLPRPLQSFLRYKINNTKDFIAFHLFYANGAVALGLNPKTYIDLIQTCLYPDPV